MADAQKKLKLQRIHATNALNYGHLGTATYVTNSANWVFLRGGNGPTHIDDQKLSAAFPFGFIGLEASTIQSEYNREATEAESFNDVASTIHAHRSVPEALSELSRHRQNAAKAISNETNFKVGLQPSQLAFGGAVAVSSSGKFRQTIPIAAVVSGRHFEAVRLLLIAKEPVLVDDLNGVSHRYQTPKIGYSEEGYWSGEGDPVQQVCFAATCDFETTQSAWMAARCRSTTTVFHPLLHAQAKSDKPASRLSPNPVLSVSITRTGGHAHADVAFNPLDHKILALVDVRGNWSIWKLDVPRHPMKSQMLFSTHLQSVGRLFTNTKLLTLHGDWHRVCWISRTPHEADRLLITSRSHAAVFTSSGINLGTLDLRTGSTKTEQIVVLDVARSTTNPAQCYVLTSTKLLLMSAADGDWTDATDNQQMAMLMSWSHFRGRADYSLSLVLAEAAQATTVLITSTDNDMVTACRVGLVPEQSPNPVSLADPSHFYLSENTMMRGRPDRNRLLAFRNLQLGIRSGSAISDKDPVLFKAFLGRPNMLLDEMLFLCRDKKASSTFGQPLSSAIPLPVIHKMQGYANVEDLGNFVVRDAEPRSHDNIPGRPLLTSLESNQTNTFTDTSTDWRDMYSELMDLDGVYDNDFRATEVAEALGGLKNQLQSQGQPLTTVQTIKEVLDVRTSLNDFEAAARASMSLTAEVIETESQRLRISRSNVPGGVTNSFNTSELQDQLRANWIRPLSHMIENKTRLAKDRLARSITADLALASMTVGPDSESNEALQYQQRRSQDPGLGSFSSSQLNATMSTGETAPEDLARAQLRRYGPLTEPIVPIATSRVLTDMLAHLPPNMSSNPADYDWRTTEARMAAVHEAEGAEKIDPKARRRAEKLAASQRRRLEAQKQISQAAEQSLAPPMVLSSQHPVIREVQSSQARPLAEEEVQTSIPLSMKQPARGTFGSRIAPVGKAQGGKKSSRKQGF